MLPGELTRSRGMFCRALGVVEQVLEPNQLRLRLGSRVVSVAVVNGASRAVVEYEDGRDLGVLELRRDGAVLDLRFARRLSALSLSPGGERLWLVSESPEDDAPHLAEELWQRLGHETTLANEPWPAWDEALLTEDAVTVIIQVLGKKRGQVEAPRDADDDTLQDLVIEAQRGSNFEVDGDDRIALLGANGNGKSTFAKLLCGRLSVMDGHMSHHKKLDVAYFAQHQIEQLRADQSPLEHLMRLDPQAREQDLRDHLGGFGFAGEQALMPSGPFSGGEKSRLVLALLVYQRPNLLLLDEPTNHLDLEMRQALAVALQDFAGAVVLVSHDRHLLRVTVDRLVLVYDGRVDDFAGSLDDYPGWLAEQNRQARVSSRDSTAVTSAAARKDRKRQEAEQRRQLQPLRKKIRAAEATLAQLHARQEQLQQSLADPAVYTDAQKPQLKALLLEKAELDSRCEALEAQWLQDSERLETLQVADLP